VAVFIEKITEGKGEVMRKYRILSLMSFLVLPMVLGGSLWAAEPAKPGKEMKQEQKAAQDNKVLAEVVKIDKKTSVITAKTDKGQKTFDATKAQLVGYDSLSAIKAGDKVAILFEGQSNNLTAKLIANHSAMMKMHAPQK
jgi:hypothetical protein